MDVSTVVSLLVALVLGAVVGAVVGVLVTRARLGTQAAVAATERDLMRERIVDLEATSGHEREIAAVLHPLADSLTRVERQVAQLERDRVEQYSRLGAQVAAVAASGEALREQTSALAGALRSSNTRGTWGETQLRRVVEHAGMLARVDFTEQPSVTAPGGHVLRPDLVVHLPGGKQLVVDAKAPLTAFLDAGAAEGDERSRLLGQHAKALRGHVDVLAGRAYWEAFSPTPEMVVCFVPGDAILAAALDADPGLHEAAMARRVVLASPATLLALLRTVAFTWQQDALAGNARELFEVGRELYSRLATLGSHSAKLGRTLHRAVEDYNALVGTLERRVLVTARRMNDLDLTSEPLPVVEPLESTPRTLTAVELIDDLELVNGRVERPDERRDAG